MLLAAALAPDVTREAWLALVERKDLETGTDLGIAPPILRSWERCLLHLDARTPPTPQNLQGLSLSETLQQQASLIESARPLMEDLYQWAEDTESVFFLTDADLCVLDVLGDPPTMQQLQHWGVRTGTYWRETQMGTNAVSLALREAIPVRVVGPEHYCEFHHALGMAAAPLNAPGGHSIGTLAVTWLEGAPHPLATALVMSATRSLENQLYADMYYQEANRRMSELNGMLSTTNEGIVCWNDENQLIYVNRRAGEILGLAPSSVTGRLLNEILELPKTVLQAVEEGRSLHDVETPLRVAERTISCLVSLHPIAEGTHRPIGHLLNIQPIQEIRRIVSRMMGSDARLSLEDLLIHAESTPGVQRQIELASRSEAPVLLMGEAGVGKSTIARAIHNAGLHSGGPFLPITCSAIPHELMLSEFLGYEAGAFGEATAQGRPSKFELAEGGTLFLDEVEELSLKMQSALLKVIESQMVMRLGATHPIHVNVRIIAATSANLTDRMANGRFRRDLYYYLSTYTVPLTPLREHSQDVVFFTRRFLQYHAQQTGRSIDIAPEALEMLQRYPWPGNIRELENVLEQVLMVCQSGRIQPNDLPPFLQRPQYLPAANAPLEPVLTLQEAEREALLRAARACRGRVTEMAECLDVSRTTVWRKMKQHQISAEDFK